MQCDDLEKTNDFYNTYYIYNKKKNQNMNRIASLDIFVVINDVLSLENENIIGGIEQELF